MSGKNYLVSVLLIIVILLVAKGAVAANKPAEWLKYFNPVPRKNYDLNESQDRLIKKKAFKKIDLPGAQPVVNKEIGLFAFLNSDRLSDQALLHELLSQERINGLSALVSWKQLEPEEDQFNFKPIDELLKICRQYNKTLILRVSTCGLDSGELIVSKSPFRHREHKLEQPRDDKEGSGLSSQNEAKVEQEPEPNQVPATLSYNGADKEQSDTPKWVFDLGAKALPYKDRDGKTHLMPIFWDGTYVASWSNFITALGAKYDKNSSIHSIGITGGGVLGSTLVVPNFYESKDNYRILEQSLKADHGMSPRQLAEHWKYTADLFLKSFHTAPLNFNIDAPMLSRAGQDTLDEISDYLVHRYGERIYLTRQHIFDAKHGFDQYRLLLKFHSDTLTGYQLNSSINADSLRKLTENAFQDGISFAEIPANLVISKNESIDKPLEDLRAHLGFQVVSKKAVLPSDIKSGESLKASFTFLNLGTASLIRPNRQLDKDVASSYKVQIELRDERDKPVVLSLHTPNLPTNQWTADGPISWDKELRMPKLKPGHYSVYMSLVDVDTKRKIQMLNDISDDKPRSECSISLGKLKVVANQ